MDERDDPPSMAEALVRRWERGALSAPELEVLESAATVAWWAWDALNAISPDRATFPRPKRKPGRDATVNLIRDIRIYHEVKLHLALERSHGREASLRQTYDGIAEKHPMLTWKGVEAVYLKERKREDRDDLNKSGTGQARFV